MIPSALPGAQARAARLGVPFRVHAILTHKCNLACSHCYQAEHRSEDLSPAELADVFAQLAELGCLYLILGGGEPLARADFWEILHEARRLKFAVELYTNGMLVDEDVARRLKEAGIAKASVSLHGGHAHTHDVFVRRRGAFDRVNRAIDFLAAAQVPVMVKSNQTSANYRELPVLRERVASRPLVRLSVNKHLYPRDDGDRSPTLFRLSEAQEHEVVRNELAALSRAEFDQVLARAAGAQRADDAANVPCQAARTTFALHPNGDVTPCTQTADLVMGNVRSRRLADIWRDSAVGTRFRALSLQNYLDEREECRACEFRKVCSRCPSLSLTESGSLGGFSEQVCQSTRVYWTEVRRRAAELGLESPV